MFDYMYIYITIIIIIEKSESSLAHNSGSSPPGNLVLQPGLRVERCFGTRMFHKNSTCLGPRPFKYHSKQWLKYYNYGVQDHFQKVLGGSRWIWFCPTIGFDCFAHFDIAMCFKWFPCLNPQFFSLKLTTIKPRDPQGSSGPTIQLSSYQQLSMFARSCYIPMFLLVRSCWIPLKPKFFCALNWQPAGFGSNWSCSKEITWSKPDPSGQKGEGSKTPRSFKRKKPGSPQHFNGGHVGRQDHRPSRHFFPPRCA